MLAQPVEKNVQHRVFVAAYVLLCAAITVYVITNCVVYHQYASFSAPLTFFSAFLADDGARNVSAMDDPSQTYFCNNTQFGWNLTAEEVVFEGPTNYSMAACSWWDMSQMSSFIQGSVVGVPTLISSTDNTDFVSRFLVDPTDHITLFINHGIQTTDGTFFFNPPVTVVDSSGAPFLTIPQGSFVSIPLKSILTLTGVSLDDTFLGPMRTYYRHSGMFIKLQISYTNMRAFDMSTDIRAVVSVSLVPTVWGVIGAVDGHPVHGIRIEVVSSGSIGAADPYQIVVYFTSAIVLFQVAKGIVLLVWEGRKTIAGALAQHCNMDTSWLYSTRSPSASDDDASTSEDIGSTKPPEMVAISLPELLADEESLFRPS